MEVPKGEYQSTRGVPKYLLQNIKKQNPKINDFTLFLFIFIIIRFNSSPSTQTDNCGKDDSYP